MTTSNAMKDTHASNGWLVALGVLLILTGIGALSFPFMITLTVEILVGSVLLVAGIFTIAHAFLAERWGGFFYELLIGAIYAFAGFVFLANPLGGAVAMTFILGCVFFAEGIVRAVMAFKVKPTQNWGWVFASGCLSILIGILLLAGMANGASLAFIGVLVGINLIFAGVSFIAIGSGFGPLPNARPA